MLQLEPLSPHPPSAYSHPQFSKCSAIFRICHDLALISIAGLNCRGIEGGVAGRGGEGRLCAGPYALSVSYSTMLLSARPQAPAGSGREIRRRGPDRQQVACGKRPATPVSSLQGLSWPLFTERGEDRCPTATRNRNLLDGEFHAGGRKAASFLLNSVENSVRASGTSLTQGLPGELWR